MWPPGRAGGWFQRHKIVSVSATLGFGIQRLPLRSGAGGQALVCNLSGGGLLTNLFPRYVPLSLPRLWMRDLVYFATRPPIAGGTSLLRVAPVSAARRNGRPIAWDAILVKAIALTARRFPELKRCYMPLPWGHFYEHPHCVATIVMERQWQGEHAVFFDQMRAPEEKSLLEIDKSMRNAKKVPPESLGSFRRLVRITRLPFPLRRLVWRFGLYGSGRLRSRYIGTFMVNSVPVRRGFTTQSMTPLSVSFFYGAVGPNGDMPIQIFFDHRVMDGAAATRLLAELNVVLCQEIVAELSATPKCESAGGMPDEPHFLDESQSSFNTDTVGLGER
jgi:hypothetical protein